MSVCGERRMSLITYYSESADEDTFAYFNEVLACCLILHDDKERQLFGDEKEDRIYTQLL